MSLPFPDQPIVVALPRASLAALRAALLRDSGPDAAGLLQEAGYAGGPALFTSFGQWLRRRGEPEPEQIDVTRFEQLASEYFAEGGWGSFTLGTLHDAVATVDSDDWWEDAIVGDSDHPGCDFTVGLFASFFGQVAEEPLAVLQVEFRAAGSPRSRFLVGSAEMLEHVYQRLADGAEYEGAVAAVA